MDRHARSFVPPHLAFIGADAGAPVRLRFAVAGGEQCRTHHVNVTATDPDSCETLMASIELIERAVEAAPAPLTRDLEVTLAREDVKRHRGSAKRCSWLRVDASESRCMATVATDGEPTNEFSCARCDVPDERLACSEFASPIVTTIADDGGRETILATCQLGGTPSECVPGGAQCWIREIAGGTRRR